MNALPHKVYVFGDQTTNFDDSLHLLLTSNNFLLRSFFDRTYHALRQEIGRLPHDVRLELPRFASLADLLSRKRDGHIGPVFEQVLCLVHALASFIAYHADNNVPYPTAHNAQVFGLCTGSLAAAAVSASRDLIELSNLALTAVVVSFRTALLANKFSRSLNTENVTASWAFLVPGASLDDVRSSLDAFCSRQTLSPLSKPYVSAHCAGGITISAPPHVLTVLRDSGVFAQSTRYLPIHAAYHAPHLYRDEDIMKILDCAQLTSRSSSGTLLPMLSAGLGHAVSADSFHGLLHEAVKDILLRPILWDETVIQVGSLLNEKTNISIVPINTTSGGALQRHLQQFPRFSVTLDAAWPPRGDVTTDSLLETSRCGRAKIAVVGMGGRFPGAKGPEALFELLMQKKDMCQEVPPLRWNVETHVDRSGKAKNTSKVRWGCWLDEPDLFDAKFFCMSPREAAVVDPAQRLALLTAYEAMEQAGIVPGETPSTRADRVGVFFGVTSNDWCETNSAQDIDTYFIPGANRAFIPGRINYFFKFTGPSYAVDTACSSSLSALHIACNALWKGDIDTAIVGGTNVLTNPDMTAGLDRGHFLSPTGNCKTFDASADGYCRGEGVATVILKRLEDAVEENDPIQGLIASAYTNHSAEAESITRPHVGAQKDIFARVLNDSATLPAEIGYIEMHGTGTQAGDSREMQSVCDVFAPENAAWKRTSEQPLHLGALKSNIGHGESVSGVSALIKVLLMMQKSTIPPHCGIKTVINPKFPTDLAERNIHIDLVPTAWRALDSKPRKAIINNFSAAGGNSSVLIEEAPRQNAQTEAAGMLARNSLPFAVSARSLASLKANVEAMIDHLSTAPTDSVYLSRLSYTTTARRIHHPFRIMVTASSIDEIRTKLGAALASETSLRRTVAPKHVVFTFTGQGSQYPGMGKQLLETLPFYSSQITYFDQLCTSMNLPSIMPLFTSHSGANIADYAPAVVQLANTCMQIALARVWISWGVKPTAVVGHSLGEYAALNISGVLSDADTVFLVGRRALLLQEKCRRGTHAMLAVLTSTQKIKQLTDGQDYELACINGPEETVLAGTTQQMSKVQQILSASSVRATLLNVPFAFHSSQVEPILESFKAEARACKFHTPRIPVMSPLLGRVVTDGDTIGAEYLARHAREPVGMLFCLSAAGASGIMGSSTTAIEFGPAPVVSGMIKSTLGAGTIALPTLRRNCNPWETLNETLSSLHNGGMAVRWTEYFDDMPLAKSVVPLPSYQWELQSHWIKYRNDWSLTKGDIVPGSSPNVIPNAKTQSAEPEPALAPSVTTVPKLETTSIHRVVSEHGSEDGCSIITETDVSRPDINPLMQGHRVDGLGLATPSCYADIAFSIGEYLLKRYPQSFPERTLDVSGMNIEKALIASGKQAQYLRVKVDMDWKSRTAKCRFYTATSEGTEVVTHATSQLRIVDESTKQRLQQSIAATKQRFETMRQACSSGATYRFNGPMAYNMVQSLADFHQDYRCIVETIYDNDNYEAACTVGFGQMKAGGTFHTHPGAIDGLTQSGGFVMNANEKTDLSKECFVNHGWDSFQLYEPIRNDCLYMTHVRMHPAEDKQWKGDVVVFTDDRVVASIGGVCQQAVPRRILKYILTQPASPAKGASGQDQKKPMPTAARQATTAPTEAAALPVQPSMSKPIPAPRMSSLWKKALSIMAEQIGVPESDLKDDVEVVEAGVDSLLSLTITGAFAEELDVEVNSDFFIEHPTVGAIKQFFLARSSDQEDNNAVEPVETAPASGPQQSSQRMPSVASSPPLPRVPTQDAMHHQDSALMTRVLDIIAEETGASKNTLTDDSQLVDAGVDSLMSLVLSGRFRDELGIDFDADVLLDQCETLGQLKEVLMPRSSQFAEGEVGVQNVKGQSDEPIDEEVSRPERAHSSATYAPQPQGLAQHLPDQPFTGNGQALAAIRIVSEETEVPLQKLTDDTVLADIGVDSLMNLVVGGRIRDELDVDLDVESILTNIRTIRDLKDAMASSRSGSTTPSSQNSHAALSATSSDSLETAPTPSPPPSEQDYMAPQFGKVSKDPRSRDVPEITAAQRSETKAASSVVLQGSPKTASHTIFFFPDGSGSAASYAYLPNISTKALVIGLNSPYLKNAEEMACTWDELVGMYVQEVRRRQPCGPYTFAGWSAGGVLAYRAAQILTAAGQTIQDLFLLDSPEPKGLGELPQHFYDYCSSIGLFESNGKTPKGLMPHFKAMCKILNSYHASPSPAKMIRGGKVHIFWAAQSITDGRDAPPFERRADDPADVDFLVKRRTDFSAGLWGHLLPGVAIQTFKLEGANHFDMMRGETASLLSAYMGQVLSNRDV